MTRGDMVIRLRQQLFDDQAVGWPFDDELLAHLDHGADYLSALYIKNKDPIMLKRITIEDGAALPDDWVAFMGSVPVAITGRVCELYDEKPVAAFYWSNFPYPSRFEEGAEMSYTHEQALLIIDMGRMFALNKNEYDLSQDVTLMDRVHSSMAKSRGIGAN